jgi:hypothetical protein
MAQDEAIGCALVIARVTLNAGGHVQDVCEAYIATETTAILWMQIVGAVWARHYDWSTMELRWQGRCVARIQFRMLATSLVRDHQQTFSKAIFTNQLDI